MKRFRKPVSLMLTALTAFGALFALSPSASAAQDTAYYTDKSGRTTYYAKQWDAWNEAVANSGTFGLLADWDAGRRVISEGKSVTVELNGHVLTRRKAKWSSDGEVIYVDKNASLTVYGGTKQNPSQNSGTSHSEMAYVSKKGDFERKAVTFKGGLIHGGNSSNGAGGIHMKEKSKVRLYYTTVAGNRAEQTWNADGYGGGVMMDGENGSLYLDHSTISYNYAYNDGGGVFVHKDAQRCCIEMVSSHIDNNTCIDNGGGIGVDAKHFRLLGDAEQTAVPETVGNWNAASMGSSVSHNYITDSDDKAGGGGGIYLKSEYALVRGINFVGNDADDGGDGGAVLIREKNVTVKNCNIVMNRADANGGGIDNYNKNNTIENCTVYRNQAGEYGGGVYVECNRDISLSGSAVIRANDSKSFTDDNLYLAGHSSTAGKNAFVIPKLKRGADVHIRTESGHMDRVSTFGAFRDDFYSFDNSTSKHIAWSSSERCLRVVNGEKPLKTFETFVPDSAKTTQSVAGGYTVKGVTYPLIKGIAQMPSCTDTASDVSSVFYYSDGYFMGSTAEYNPHLATLSMNLAGAAGYSNTVDGYLDKSKNFRQLMSDIGCADENIYVNDFNLQKPSTDTIGAGIASKKLPDGSTLVIVGVRGMGYEAEWVSNMTLGTSGEAKGFSSAANQVFAELKSYLERYGIDGTSEKTKFWIAGYSRAGATSNLTAKRIVDAYDNGGERTFAYPVEAPKGGLESLKKSGCNYGCIHNIINQNDIVPWVGTTEMGFIRYGVDHYVPGSVTANASNTAWNVGSGSYNSRKTKMLSQLAALNSEVPFDDYFHSATINYVSGAVFSAFGYKMIGETSRGWTTEDFIDVFFTVLQNYALFYGDHPRTTYAGTVAAKSKTFEQAACVVAKLLFGRSDEDLNGLTECFTSLIERLSTQDLAKLYLAIRNDEFHIFSSGSSVSQSQLAQISSSSWWQSSKRTIWNKLTTLSEDDEACGYHALNEYLSDAELKELDSCFDALMVPLIQFICMDYKEYDQDLVGTTAYNISRIISNHYPEVTCAWLRSYDSFYDNDTSPVMMSSSVMRAPSAPAVKIIGAGGEERFVYSDSDVITVKTDDSISFVPSNETDRNAGEAIYYHFTTGKKAVQGTHCFTQPFVFGEMRADYATSGEFAVAVQAAHYGQIQSERTFRFRLEGTCIFQTPQRYNNGYTYQNNTLTLGDTLSISGVKPDAVNTYRFKEWKVYPIENNVRSDTPLDAKLYAQVFGEAFDPYAETASVTNNMGKSFLFEPHYITVITELTVDCNPLMDYIDCYNGSNLLAAELPVVWDTDDSFCFVGTFTLRIPEGMELAENAEIVFDYYNGYPDFVNLETMERSGSDVTITMNVYADFSEIMLQSFYEVEARDMNSGAVLGSVYFCKEMTASGGNDIRVMAPSYPDMEFVKWSDDVHIMTGTFTDDNIIVTRTGAGDNKGVAYYRPIVRSVTLTLDKSLTAGESMPALSGLTATVANDWRIDNAALEWVKNDAAAQYRTVYTAHVTVDKTTLAGTNLSVPGSQSVPLAGAFTFDDLTLTVRAADGSTPQVTSVYCSDENDVVCLDVTFAETAKQKLTSHAPVSVTVPHGSTQAQIVATLPDTLCAYAQDGAALSIPVTWNSVDAFDPDMPDAQTVTAHGTADAEEYDCSALTVTAEVSVLGAAKTAVPEAGPSSGAYTGIQQITLTSEEDAAVYCAVAVTEDGEQPPETASLSFTACTDPITLNQYGKTVYLFAYASKDGLPDSELITYTYELTKPEVIPLAAKAASITENGNIACFYSTKTVTYDNSDTGETEEITVPDVYYADGSCTAELTEEEVTLPAFIKASYTVTENADPNLSGFGYEDGQTIDALETLGVQRTSSENTLRVVTASDSRILRDAADYGYQLNGQRISCKSTANTSQNGYGSLDFGATPYKYVSADITLSNLQLAVTAQFYVTLENGTDVIFADETALAPDLPGSAAQTANVSVSAWQRGDVNNDGAVTIDDATLLQEYLAEYDNLLHRQLMFADANLDGHININDVTEIQRHAAEFDALPTAFRAD